MANKATEIHGKQGTYLLGKLVGEVKGEYRLYLCTRTGESRQLLLQVADGAAKNGALDRSAYILTQMAEAASALETEYAGVKSDPTIFLNYDILFPQLIESFIFTAQGNRRINILAFKNVDALRQVVPASNIMTKDRTRIDARSSAWFLGKLLKLLVFTQSEGFANDALDATNILLEPDQHYVTVFDWSKTMTHTDGVPIATRRSEIMKVTRVIIALLGGDYARRSFPEGIEDEYKAHLLRLASGSEPDADKAHQEFYSLIRALWGRKFHPFTTFSL